MYIIYIYIIYDIFPLKSPFMGNVPLPPFDDTICWVPFSKEWEFSWEKGMIFFRWFYGQPILRQSHFVIKS